jgi:hypothetical protein
MNDIEFKQAINDRRMALKMSLREVQRKTGLGYNTIRRLFDNPMLCKMGSVIRVASVLGCCFDFVVENRIGTEIESDIPLQPMKQDDVHG